MGITMEEALLVVDEQVGYDNIAYASCINKATIVF